MAYAPPSIGPAGLTINSYDDIKQFLLDAFRSIYGTNVYLGNDSADYQLIANVALAAADCNSALQLAVNQFSPISAVGGGLSTLVAVNGLKRKTAGFSACLVILSGTAGSVVNNGVIKNSATGDLWDLPPSVTIGGGGTVVVTATAEVSGSVNALASQLTVIVTPSAGWVSVTNGSNVPTVGQPVELDYQLRQRQAISTSLPSRTVLSGTLAGIAATLGVTRSTVDENFTNAANANGNPAHSITAVVEGGTDLDVATAIFDNRGIGPLTNGNGSATVVTVSITDSNSGVAMNINFNRPTYAPIYVTVTSHLYPGGTAALQTDMAAALVAYLNGLQIGEPVNYGALVQAAMSVNPNPLIPLIGVRTLFFGLTVTPTTITDVVLPFYKVAQGDLAKIIITPV